MNKRLFIIGIAALLICIGLSGCVEQINNFDDNNPSNEKNALIVTFMDFSEAVKDQYYTSDFVRLNLSVINTRNQFCIISNVYAITSDGEISYFYPEFSWGKTVSDCYLVPPKCELIFSFNDRPGIGTTMDLNKEIIESSYDGNWVLKELPDTILMKKINCAYSNDNLPGTFELSLEITNQYNRDISLKNFCVVTDKNNCYDLDRNSVVTARNGKTITKSLATLHNAVYPSTVEESEIIVFYAGFPYYNWYLFDCSGQI